MRFFLSHSLVALVVLSAAQSFAEKGKSATPPTTKSAPPSAEDGEFVTEKRSDGTTVKYKKKATYDFEGTGIEGLYNKPSGSYISNIKDVKGRSIIRIRENFDAEVIDSARQLR